MSRVWPLSLPGLLAGPNYVELLKDIRRTTASPVVLRFITENICLYHNILHIYTGGPFHRGLSSGTAAFTIPTLGIDWSMKLNLAHSSEITEMVAIFETLPLSQS